MATNRNLTELLQAIADAIKEKKSYPSSKKINAQNFPREITSIYPVTTIEKTITENGTYIALSEGADGYSKVIINVPTGGLTQPQLHKPIAVWLSQDKSWLYFQDTMANGDFTEDLHIYIGTLKVGECSKSGKIMRFDLGTITTLSREQDYEVAIKAAATSFESSPLSDSVITDIYNVLDCLLEEDKLVIRRGFDTISQVDDILTLE